MTAHCDFFGKEVEIYTSAGDPSHRHLYRASALAEKFGYATNKVGMYLARRRSANSGIFQATSFRAKPPGRTGLKAGGYFLTMDACLDFETHFKQHDDMLATNMQPATNTGSGSGAGQHGNNAAAAAAAAAVVAATTSMMQQHHKQQQQQQQQQQQHFQSQMAMTQEQQRTLLAHQLGLSLASHGGMLASSSAASKNESKEPETRQAAQKQMIKQQQQQMQEEDESQFSHHAHAHFFLLLGLRHRFLPSQHASVACSSRELLGSFLTLLFCLVLCYRRAASVAVSARR
jgi:hypothetical protein